MIVIPPRAFCYGLGKRVVAYTGGRTPHPWTVYVASAIRDDRVAAVTELRGG